MPVHQTARDADVEAGLAAALERAWNGRLLRLPKLSPVDWLVERGDRVVAVVEGKRRRHALGAFPTVWLEVAKRDALTAVARAFRLDPLRAGVFLVCWDDAIGWTSLGALRGLGETVRRRADRAGEAADRVVEVPVERFRLVLDGREEPR